MKKITKRENFEKIIEVLEGAGRPELVEVIAHEIELLDKKKASGKMTKNQEANEVLKAQIVEILENSTTALTITEIMNINKDLGSNQKISALMTQLKNAGVVERVQEGKTARFTLAQEQE